MQTMDDDDGKSDSDLHDIIAAGLFLFDLN